MQSAPLRAGVTPGRSKRAERAKEQESNKYESIIEWARRREVDWPEGPEERKTVEREREKEYMCD